MSEADYVTFQSEHRNQQGPLADKVEISLNGRGVDREGTLDFIDNSLDRSSGTIHGRATVQNTDRLLTPGAFARVRVAVSKPAPALLIPDASVLPDQSEHVVLTVDSNDVVTPKKVELGDLRDGLRVIRSGLTSSDRVIVAGIPKAKTGAKVVAEAKSIRSASN
jgi:RND family efflux transporter MFP subunit